jgi:hypothetical protein
VRLTTEIACQGIGLGEVEFRNATMPVTVDGSMGLRFYLKQGRQSRCSAFVMMMQTANFCRLNDFTRVSRHG